MDSILGIRTAAAPAPKGGTPAESDGRKSPPGGGELPAAARPEVTRSQVDQAIRQIESYLSDSQRELQIQVDKDSGRTIVRVIDAETQAVIRQIPSEEVLTLARAMGNGAGQIFSQLG